MLALSACILAANTLCLDNVFVAHPLLEGADGAGNERNAIVVVTRVGRVAEVGRTFCTANSDGDRRDTSPRAAGEINAGAGGARGKISCLDQRLPIPGLPLPIH